MKTSHNLLQTNLTVSLLLTILLMLLSACQLQTFIVSSPSTATITTTVTATSTPEFTATITTTSTLIPPTSTPRPTFTPAPYSRPPLETIGLPLTGSACMGNAETISCLDTSGWKHYSSESLTINDGKILSLAACPNDHIFALGTEQLQKLPAEESSPIALPALTGPNKLYCDSMNRLWVSFYGGIAVHTNGTWVIHDATQLSVGSSSSQVITDFSGDLKGNVWVSTLHSLASYAEGEWAVFQDGYGFTGDFLFSSLAVSHEGIPWAGYTSGLLALDGITWREVPYSQLGPVNDLLIRAGGQAWAATNNGLHVYENGVWSAFNRSNSDIPSNYINAIAVDGNNRLWTATAWGLAVYLDGSWSVLQANSSEISVNNLQYLVVTGNGPELPLPIKKPAGDLVMTLVTRYAELSNKAVDLCVEPLGYGYNGPTPCADQPFHLAAKTDYKGRLVLTDIPAGQYLLAVEMKPGEWTTIRDTQGSLQYFEVKSGTLNAYGNVTVPLLQ